MNLPNFKPSCGPMTSAERRYSRRVLRTMAVYACILIAVAFLLRGPAANWPTPLKALLVILPVIPLAFFGKAFITYLSECDELVRRIELEAVSLSSLLVGLLYMASGFLMQARIFSFDGAVVAIWVLPIMCGCYGLTKWLAIRRYR